MSMAGTPGRRALRGREGAIFAASRGPRGGVGGDGSSGAYRSFTYIFHFVN